MAEEPRAALFEDLARAFLALPGIEAMRPRFGGQRSFGAGGRELAHFHKLDAVDIRLGKAQVRALRSALRADPRYLPRKNASPWAEFRVDAPEDIPGLCAWLQRARADS